MKLYTGSLQDRGIKIKETMKHRLGWKKESLNKETVSYCCNTRSGNKNKHYVKATIDRTQTDPKCRMWKQSNETIGHIVSACPKLAQKEYKRRHDNIAGAIDWDLSRKYGFQRNERWYDHVPDSVQYFKMRITRCYRILVYEQTMKLRLGDQIYWSSTKKRTTDKL